MQAPLKSLLFPDTGEELDHRARLLEAMARALTEQSYAAVTIADVVRRARVSKRTFYEHFPDKEACYVATYTALSQAILRRIAQAATRGGDAEQQLREALRAYIGALEAWPALTRSFLTEIQAVGPGALRARREVHRQFAQLVRSLIEQGRAQVPEARGLSPAMATAVVGGIHELLLETLEGGDDDLSGVQDTAFALLRAVLLAPADVDVGPPARKPQR